MKLLKDFRREITIFLITASLSFMGGLLVKAYEITKMPSANKKRIEVVEKDVTVLKNLQENNVSKEWMKNHVKASDENYAKKDQVNYIKENIDDIKTDMKIIKEHLINRGR